MKSGERLTYELRRNQPILFVNPLLVAKPGAVSYQARDGVRVASHARIIPSESLKIRMEKPVIGEAHLPQEFPWEKILSPYRTVLYEDGKYRMWYESVPASGYEDYTSVLSYAESDDGFRWKKPKLGLIAYQSSRKTNLVFPTPDERFFTAGCVFKDPCDPEFPYKLTYLSVDKTRHHPRLILWGNRTLQDDGITHNCAKLAVSKDGLRWTILERPIVPNFYPDTYNIIHYHCGMDKYVGFFRGRLFGERTIAYAETDDLLSWPRPETILFSESPYYNLESNSYSVYPFNESFHFLFAADHNLLDDGTAMQAVYTSVTGKHWSRIDCGERGLFVPADISGKRQGVTWAGTGLVPLNGGRTVGLPVEYQGNNHDYCFSGEAHTDASLGARLESLPGFLSSELRWALWDKDRLGSIGCDSEGHFSTINFRLPEASRCELHLNFKTTLTGDIQVQIADTRGMPVAGYTFDECRILTGNQADAVVSWGRKKVLPRKEDLDVPFTEFTSKCEYEKDEVAGICVQFRLKNARIYSLTIV